MPWLGDDPGLRATYFNADGSPKKLGETVVNPAVAETMQQIADRGAKAFYEGPVAAEMVSACAAMCGPAPVARRSRGLPAGQARAGCDLSVWIVCSAAHLVRRHRHHRCWALEPFERRTPDARASTIAQAAGSPCRPQPLRRRPGLRRRSRGRPLSPSSPNAAS
jgi:hypothetical protein